MALEQHTFVISYYQ